MNDKIWIGADPGGVHKFGVAILFPDLHDLSQWTFRTASVNNARAAIEWVSEELTPLGIQWADVGGVGIDAPLWWSNGQSSDRMADQRLRKHYKLVKGEIQSANSLRGAALVQGMLLAEGLRKENIDLGVTETHPKVLFKQFFGSDWGGFCSSQAFRFTPSNEHELDAAISAYAAREGFLGHWSHDLALKRNPGEQDPSQHWLSPVHYFWPQLL